MTEDEILSTEIQNKLSEQQGRIADLSNTVHVMTGQLGAKERQLQDERHRRNAEMDGFKAGALFVIRIILDELREDPGGHYD